LIELHVDVDQKLDDGRVPLHLAANKGHVEILNHLITAGARLNEICTRHKMALHWAVRSRQTEIVKRLIDLGMSDTTDIIGCTALHRAIHYHHAEMIQSLIKAGSDVYLADPFGYSPLEYASRDPEFFRGINPVFQQKYIPASEAERQRKRRSSILAAIRLAKNTDGRIQNPDIYYLGRQLLFFGDEENALWGILRNASLKGQSLRHCAYCNICQSQKDDEKIEGTRFICRKCPQVDLCDSCMVKYLNGATLPGCRGHDFFRIPRADKDDLVAEFQEVQKMPLNEWLEQLLAKYDDHQDLVEMAQVDEVTMNSNIPDQKAQHEVYQPSRLRWYWSQVQNWADDCWESIMPSSTPEGYMTFQWTCVSSDVTFACILEI
jgi:hypothetical protein